MIKRYLVRLVLVVSTVIAICRGVPPGPVRQGSSMVTRSTGKACYRQVKLNQAACPNGFSHFLKTKTCISECPLAYPVLCGLECIPQSQSCAVQVLDKITAVGTVVVNAATAGIAGAVGKQISVGLKCALQLSIVTKGLVKLVNGQGDAKTAMEAITAASSSSSLITTDLPVALATCLGFPSAEAMTNQVKTAVQAFLNKFAAKKDAGADFKDQGSILSLAKESGISAITKEIETEMIKLFPEAKTDAMCGWAFKGLIEQAWKMTEEYRDRNPTKKPMEVRLAIMGSTLVLEKLPAAAASCYSANTAEMSKRREQVIKKIHLMIEAIVETVVDQDTKRLTPGQLALKVADFGLSLASVFDSTGISTLIAEFAQGICQPTANPAGIAVGDVASKLGLTTAGSAFTGAKAEWKPATSPALVTIKFENDDDEVDVVMYSGGYEYQTIKVGRKAALVAWSAPLDALKGKSLYVIRRRKCFLGFRAAGSSSLVIWVPEGAAGNLELKVTINPPSAQEPDAMCSNTASRQARILRARE